MRTTYSFQPVTHDARVRRSLVSPSVLAALEISTRQAPRVHIATMTVVQRSASAYRDYSTPKKQMRLLVPGATLVVVIAHDETIASNFEINK